MIPYGAPFPIVNRTHLQSPSLLLAGKDQFFGAPGMGPDYDWPNPRGYPFPISNRTWLNSINLNLLGKDQMFGGAGQPLSHQEWDNPLPLRYPVDNRTFVRPAWPLLPGGGAKPVGVQTFELPPRGAARNVVLLGASVGSSLNPNPPPAGTAPHYKPTFRSRRRT